MKKKLIVIFIMVLFLFILGCQGKTDESRETEKKAEKTEKVDEKEKEEVYAKYRVNIYNDKNLTDWLATLAKGEKVEFVEEISHKKNNNKINVAKIVRADGETKGFLERRHLTGKPVVIVKDNLKLYEQPTITSRVYARVTKGTVAFVQGKKDNWTKIYIGYIDDNGERKYIDGKWIKEGFSSDITLVQEGLVYDRATSMLEDDKDANNEKAKDDLEELIKTESMYSELSKKTIMDFESEEMME